jgi:hypothetical protein
LADESLTPATCHHDWLQNRLDSFVSGAKDVVFDLQLKWIRVIYSGLHIIGNLNQSAVIEERERNS